MPVACRLHVPASMSDTQSTNDPEAVDPNAVADLLAKLTAREVFGPPFFIHHLGAYARDQCPDPSEGLPFVHLHLMDGTVLDLCHVLGLTPRWVALAVYEGGAGSVHPRMRTELVPYEQIIRVSISAGAGQTGHMGFRQEAPLAVEPSPEDTLERISARSTKSHKNP